MNLQDMHLLQEIWEYFDGIADGAPDGSYHEKQALHFSDPLKDLIKRLSEDPIQRELTEAHASGSDRVWDEAVVSLRNRGLIP